MGLRKEEMIQESITSVRTRTVITVEVEGLLNSIMMFVAPVHFEDEFKKGKL